MEAIEAIMTRKSIRKFKTTPITNEVLQKILEAARWAPSWANTQCWHFIVVRNQDIKEKLASLLPVRNPSVEAVKNAPILIVACAEHKKSGFYKGEATTEKGDTWYMFDLGLAMENLVLAAHALGLGAVHVGNFNGQKAAEILGVPAGFSVIEMAPLGYPDAGPVLQPRKELSEIVFYDGWGKKESA